MQHFFSAWKQQIPMKLIEKMITFSLLVSLASAIDSDAIVGLGLGINPWLTRIRIDKN